MNLRVVRELVVKELIGLWRDRVLLIFVLYAFSMAVYAQGTGITHDLQNAPIAVLDNDNSPLSQAVVDGFLPPRFQPPRPITPDEIDPAMDSARYIFVLEFPPDFQSDVLAGRSPAIQLLIDATAVMQAGIGAGIVQSIVEQEVARFLKSADGGSPVELKVRIAFNQTLESSWFTGTMALVNNITMLAVLLSGAALIREREHGTIEHLLVLPVRPLEIMLGKVLANGLVIVVLAGLSILGVLQSLIGMQIAGSVLLFLLGVVLYLFFASSLGIFLGVLTGSMAQFGLVFMLVVLPMNLLSGGMTPLESMPRWLQLASQASPSTQFVAFAQAILYRGAGLETVWPRFLATFAVGLLFFIFSLRRFGRFLASQR